MLRSIFCNINTVSPYPILSQLQDTDGRIPVALRKNFKEDKLPVYL